jgi:acyl carrier protein
MQMTVRSEIVAQFTEVAREHSKQIPSLTDDMELLDSGLDSLCFAVVVARLEDALGVDPFSASEDTRFPVTFGEFVTLYEHAAQ